MKKSDSLTLVGLLAGVVMVIWGMNSSAGFKIFLDFPSVVITVGGSFCALLVNYSLDEIKNIRKLFNVSTKNMKLTGIDVLNQFTDVSKAARREGILSIEDQINQIDDEFMKNGLSMVVDGIEPETIREVMELEIDEMTNRHARGANIIRSWGGYAPAFGMLGTLIGLIQMLANVNDTSAITAGVARALISTFYGAILAYVVLNPIASNLVLKNEKEVALREMMVEGVLSIQAGANPRVIEQKLLTFLSPNERLEYIKFTNLFEGAVNNG